MTYQSKEQPTPVDHELVFQQALQQAADHLRTQWFGENVGIVAATLVEDTHSVSATSLYIAEENRWLHAEAVALRQFENQFGRKPNSSSTMIVTLSPCVQESSSRHGVSCSRRLQDAGITRVRFGHLDQAQAQDSTYLKMGFDARLTGDKPLQKTCASLYSLFDQIYRPEGRFHYLLEQYQNPWPEIKRIIGLGPFAALHTGRVKVQI